MSDPRRWLEGDAPGEVQELLRHAQAPRALSAQARARSRSRVVALSTLPMAAGFMLWLPQVALGAVLGAAGTGLVVVATERFKDPPPVHSAVSVPGKPAPRSAPRAPVVPAPAPSVAPPEPVAPPTPSAAPRASVPASSALPSEDLAAEARNALNREIALLEQARRQMNGNPAAALRTLRDHELLFPSGQLRIEREFLVVDALVRSGNRPAAEARARALEAQAPRSLYGERLKRILSGAPSSGSR